MSQIKEKVEEKEGIPPVQQRLIFGGKQMYVSHSLPQHSYQKLQIRHSHDSTYHFTSWLWSRFSTYPAYPAIYPPKVRDSLTNTSSIQDRREDGCRISTGRWCHFASCSRVARRLRFLSSHCCLISTSHDDSPPIRPMILTLNMILYFPFDYGHFSTRIPGKHICDGLI